MLSCIIFRKESDSGHLGADFTTFSSKNCQVKVRRPKTGPSDRKFGTIIRPKKSQESSLFISGPFGACFLWIWAQNCKTNFFKQKTTENLTPDDSETIFGQHFFQRFRFWDSQGLVPTLLGPKLQNNFFKNPISSYIILYYAPHSYPHMRGVWYMYFPGYRPSL